MYIFCQQGTAPPLWSIYRSFISMYLNIMKLSPSQWVADRWNWCHCQYRQYSKSQDSQRHINLHSPDIMFNPAILLFLLHLWKEHYIYFLKCQNDTPKTQICLRFRASWPHFYVGGNLFCPWVRNREKFKETSRKHAALFMIAEAHFVIAGKPINCFCTEVSSHASPALPLDALRQRR